MPRTIQRRKVNRQHSRRVQKRASEAVSKKYVGQPSSETRVLPEFAEHILRIRMELMSLRYGEGWEYVRYCLLHAENPSVWQFLAELFGPEVLYREEENHFCRMQGSDRCLQ